ncbi:MAG: hypothetical protein AB7T37_06865 [Dehalococcoidia bacterium]
MFNKININTKYETVCQRQKRITKLVDRIAQKHTALHRVCEVITADPGQPIFLTGSEVMADLISARGFLATASGGFESLAMVVSTSVFSDRFVVLVPDWNVDEPEWVLAYAMSLLLDGARVGFAVQFREDLCEFLWEGGDPQEIIDAAAVWQIARDPFCEGEAGE